MIGGDVTVENGDAASSGSGTNIDISHDILTEVFDTGIGGDLYIRSEGDGENHVTIDGATVGGTTEIDMGDDDDFITIVDSFFSGDVEIDGGDDDDTVEFGPGNTFDDGIDLDDIELVILPP